MSENSTQRILKKLEAEYVRRAKEICDKHAQQFYERLQQPVKDKDGFAVTQADVAVLIGAALIEWTGRLSKS